MSSPYINLSKDDEWYTPKYIVNYFGKFEYDPATTKDKAKEFGIPEYDTIKTNGLDTDWTKYNKIWINPPFTNKKEFLEKAYNTFLQTHNEIYIILPIAYLTTKSFYRIVKGGILYIPNGRFKFEKSNGLPSSSPALGTFILKLDDEWKVVILDLEIMRKKNESNQ